MNVVFYLSAIVAVVSTVLVITRTNVMHALLNLVLSLLAVALMFYTLGAPFIAILEVMVYAGAIMVLFIFAIMMLNLGTQTTSLERQWLESSGWIAPAVLAVILLGEVVYVLVGRGGTHAPAGTAVDPRQVGVALFTTYLIGVELASVLLLASLVGAFHLGRPRRKEIRLDDHRIMQAKETAIKESMPAAPVSKVEAQEARQAIPAGQSTGTTPARNGSGSNNHSGNGRDLTERKH